MLLATARRALLVPALAAGIVDTAADVAPAPLFSAPGLVDVGGSFPLPVNARGLAVQGWRVQWGDGAETTSPAAGPLTHVYRAAGLYEVSVAATLADGKAVPAARDETALVLDDHPLACFTFGPRPAGAPSSPETLGDESLDPRPDTAPSGLPWGAAAASFGHGVVHLPSALAANLDSFSVDFWLRTADIQTPQDILASGTPAGSRLTIAGGNLVLELPKGAVFSLPLPPGVRDGQWHHIAVSYDRAPLFPYSNIARFSVDGILAGRQHLDLYDTGPVSLSDGTLGSDAMGGRRLLGALAGLAIYDHVLAPHRVLAHAGVLNRPRSAIVLAAPPSVQPFTVDLPRISQTVNVPLDPTPGVDNGPALRAAVAAAEPGTRLLLVNKTTNQPGGTFYINSLDSGNDWSALRIFSHHDLELDGGGATLLFGVADRQIYIKDCQRVAVRNLSIDLDQTKFRVGVYARLLSLDTATGDARFQFVNGRDLSPDRGVPATIGMWRWRPHDPKTLRITEGPYFKTGEAFEQPPQRDPSDPSILTGRLKRDLIGKLEAYRQGANFFMINNARFENSSVGLESSEHITFEHVNYYATLGMVFLSGEENHVQVLHCKIGLPPGLTAADRPLASGADGYHFHETQGDILFEGNEEALTDDDPITIKDGVFRDVAVADNNALTLKAGAGDEIALYNWDFSPLPYHGHVVQMQDGKAQMAEPLPDNLPKSFIALDLRHHTNNWILRDNHLHDYYGRLLLCTAHGLITGNVIEGSYLHLGASNASFDNAGISSAVTVYNNLLDQTYADTGIWGWDSTYPVFQNIVFYQNSFMGKNLTIRNAGAPWIVGNYFEPGPESDAPRNAASPAVSIDQTQTPFVLNNVELTGQPGDFQLDLKATDGLTARGNSTVVAR